MNTPAGGQKVRETMIKKYGSEEEWKAFMRSIASIGGKAKVPKGFAISGKASEAGSIGGKISKRPKRADYIPEPPKRRFLFWSY